MTASLKDFLPLMEKADRGELPVLDLPVSLHAGCSVADLNKYVGALFTDLRHVAAVSLQFEEGKVPPIWKGVAAARMRDLEEVAAFLAKQETPALTETHCAADVIVPISEVFADGGVLGGSRSAVAGVFAWCHVADDDTRLAIGGGYVLPETSILWEKQDQLVAKDMPIPCITLPADTVTNNQTEFMALLATLEALPAGWSGVACSDSAVTLGRFFEGFKNNEIPRDWLVRRLAAQKRLGEIVPRLVAGHPARQELASGRTSAGEEVSPHNDWCHKHCEQLKSLARRLAGS